MNEREQKDIAMMVNLNEKFPQIPEEQRQFLLGFMEGISQMTESKKKRKRKAVK